MNIKCSIPVVKLQDVSPRISNVNFSRPVLIPLPGSSSCYPQQKPGGIHWVASAREQLLQPVYLPDSIELFKALLLMAFNR